jgi:hypothetical protein
MQGCPVQLLAPEVGPGFGHMQEGAPSQASEKQLNRSFLPSQVAWVQLLGCLMMYQCLISKY